MPERMKALKELIVEVAALEIAAEEFSELEGDKNADVLSTIQAELCRAEIDLIDYVLDHGAFLRLILITEESSIALANGNGASLLADLSKEQIRKILFG